MSFFRELEKSVSRHRNNMRSMAEFPSKRK